MRWSILGAYGFDLRDKKPSGASLAAFERQSVGEDQKNQESGN
jgi:hypothetical protein